jgi:hypothetical protein
MQNRHSLTGKATGFIASAFGGDIRRLLGFGSAWLGLPRPDLMQPTSTREKSPARPVGTILASHALFDPTTPTVTTRNIVAVGTSTADT